MSFVEHGTSSQIGPAQGDDCGPDGGPDPLTRRGSDDSSACSDLEAAAADACFHSGPRSESTGLASLCMSWGSHSQSPSEAGSETGAVGQATLEATLSTVQ